MLQMTLETFITLKLDKSYIQTDGIKTQFN